jgi:hypothetical protein
LRTYRVARQQRCCNLMTHTAALSAYLIDSPVDTRQNNLDAALGIFRDACSSGTPLDAKFFDVLVSIAGRTGDPDSVRSILADFHSSGIEPSKDTPAAAVEAFLTCRALPDAVDIFYMLVYGVKGTTPPPGAPPATPDNWHRGVLPSRRVFIMLIVAQAAAGYFAMAIELLEQQVQLGITPDAGTLAAVISACNRADAHELAYRALQVGRSRGIEVDGTIAFLFSRVAYSKIRSIWVPPIGYPPPRTEEEREVRLRLYYESREGYGTELGNEGVDPELSRRLLKALAGRDLDVEIVGDGPDVATAWRSRVHSIYRCALHVSCCDWRPHPHSAGFLQCNRLDGHVPILGSREMGRCGIPKFGVQFLGTFVKCTTLISYHSIDDS